MHDKTTLDRDTTSHSYTRFVALMGAFLDGYDLVIIAGAMLFIKVEMGLTPGQIGWVAAITFAGMVVGALAFGRMTDRIGRQGAFAFVLVLFVVGSLVSAFATGPLLLLLGRLIVGLGIGADLPVSTTLIAETAPHSRRGALVGLMQVFWFAGAAASGLAGLALYSVWGDSSWRWMLGSAAVIAIAVMVLRRRVPESEHWANKQIADDTSPSGGSVKTPASSGVGALRLLLLPGIGAALAFSCLFWFLVTIRGAGFNLYTPTFFAEVGLSGVKETLLFSAGVNVVNTLAALAAVTFLDRIGRRPVVLLCWGLSTVLTFGLAAIATGSPVWMFVLITVSALPLQVVAMALFALSVEPFPTLVRGTAQGLSSASGKAGGFIAALWFPTLLVSLGWRNTALALGGLMTCGLVIGLLIKVPETRQRRLESLEEELVTNSSGSTSTPVAALTE